MTPASSIALLTALAYAVDLLLLARLHWRYRQFDVLRNTVSDYGVGPSARAFALYGALGSAAALALAGAVWLTPGLPRTLAWTLVAMVVARIGVSAVPTDPTGTPATMRGRVHLLFAIATFALAYQVIADATPWLQHTGMAGTVLSALRWLVAGALAGVVVTLVVRPWRKLFGGIERVFLVGTLVGFLCISLALAAPGTS